MTPSERHALAEKYEQRGKAALDRPQRAIGSSPLHKACALFDKAVALQIGRAASIGEHLLQRHEPRAAIRYKKRELKATPVHCERRAQLATQIGDIYLTSSHAARLCYRGHDDKRARRHYDLALAADPHFYQAHMGRCGSLVDKYHHTCRTHFWRGESKGDVYVFEQAVRQWCRVLTSSPQSMVKTWLRSPDLIFEQRASPRTATLYTHHVVPALGRLLADSNEATAPDEELMRLTLVCTRRLIDREPWLIAHLSPYLLDATNNPGLSSANMPEMLRIQDKIAHAPFPEGMRLARAARRLRHRFENDSGVLMMLVALQKIMLDAYSQQEVLVLGAVKELAKLAHDNVPVAYDAFELMLTTIVNNPSVAPTAITLLAQAAADTADDNIADADVLADHVIDQLRMISNHPKPGIAMAVANALQGPLRKYYDAYRAREEDARRAREDTDAPPADAVPDDARRGTADGGKPRRRVTFAPRPR